jgi:hypothetical protein
MPGLLSGAAAAISFVTPATTDFDAAAVAGAGFLQVRLNGATQAFERKLASIDYKIQRQQLHREDIRDLVDLTIARMDIYHLIGTLLLAFCMAWFTDSSLWELPVWFSDLFLISNFGAVGYLVLCVWLSMYATIASRSVGTRLLTSYARLSIPTSAQIEEIKYPIFANLSDKIADKIAGVGPKKKATDKKGVEEGEGGSSYVEYISNSEDNQQHFRRFRQELPKWLVYDTWSRVCATFGLNQMLQSLSYFSLGIIWLKSPLAAIMSFVAINVFSTIILWLDVGDLNHTWQDYVAILFLTFLPPVLAITLLLYELIVPRVDDEEFRGAAGVLCVLCFWAHAAWLWYLVNLFWTAGSKDSRFQPGAYADVLEWIKSEETENNHEVSTTRLVPAGEGLISTASAIGPLGHGTGANSYESGGAFSVLVTEEWKKQRLAEKQEVNGGREIGVWQSVKRTKKGQDDLEHPDLDKTNWLPVKMMKYFTIMTICWWSGAGVSHGLLISFHQHNKMIDFTGSNVLPVLSDKTNLVQWPSPARLFKVAALHCSDSSVWVSSKFSMYALMQGETSNTFGALQHISEGRVNAVICGANGCDALSPPSDARSEWLLTSMKESGGPGPRKVALPQSWLKVTGAWSECPEASTETCTVAWLAGWDGHTVTAATLQMGASADDWVVHSNFEADPAVGLCSGGHSPACGQPGPRTYDDVSALQMGAGGRSLMVMSGGGVIDVWNLAKGAVMQRMHLGESYTSMCRSGESVFLSRQGKEGPIVASMPVPSSLASRTATVGSASHTEASSDKLVDKLAFLSRHDTFRQMPGAASDNGNGHLAAE